MADEGEIIELALTGVDKVTTKYHDIVWDQLPSWKKREVKEKERARARARSLPGSERGDNYHRDRDRDDYYRDDTRSQYSGRNSMSLVRRDDGYSRDRDFRDAYPNGNEVGRRSSTYYPGGAPPDSYMRNPYPADSIILERDRYRNRSRSRSHDRPRRRSRSRRRSSSDENQKFEPKHKYTPAIMGAVAGGLVGRNVADGDRLATVASAIIGAVGAKHGYREFEKRKTRKNRREDREWEEEYGEEDEERYDERDGRERFRGGRDGRINFSRSRSR